MFKGTVTKKETVEAIKASIEKYKGIIPTVIDNYRKNIYLFDGIIIGRVSCPLCRLFNNDSADACTGCPINDITHDGCETSPYRKVSRLFDELKNRQNISPADVTAFINSVTEEIIFLTKIESETFTVSTSVTCNKVYPELGQTNLFLKRDGDKVLLNAEMETGMGKIESTVLTFHMKNGKIAVTKKPVNANLGFERFE